MLQTLFGETFIIILKTLFTDKQYLTKNRKLYSQNLLTVNND